MKIQKKHSLILVAALLLGWLLALLSGCQGLFAQDLQTPFSAGVLAWDENRDARVEVIGRQFVPVGMPFTFTVRVTAKTRHDAIAIEAAAPGGGVSCAMPARINVWPGTSVNLSCQGQFGKSGDFTATANVWAVPAVGERDRYRLNFVFTSTNSVAKL